MRDQLALHLSRALAATGLEAPAEGVALEAPKQPEHGDWTTNVALQVAKSAGRPPREVAAEIVSALEADPPPNLLRAEVAGPGFINLHLAPAWSGPVGFADTNSRLMRRPSSPSPLP